MTKIDSLKFFIILAAVIRREREKEIGKEEGAFVVWSRNDGKESGDERSGADASREADAKALAAAQGQEQGQGGEERACFVDDQEQKSRKGKGKNQQPADCKSTEHGRW